VIVRAFRKGGIDLQKQVHEDMVGARSEYPMKWGNGGPDANIDHRRVLNLRTYFERQDKSLPVTANAIDYFPGDVVTWDLGNGLDHIGIVVNMFADKEERYLIVHNVGAGARLEDVLFAWKITGTIGILNKPRIKSPKAVCYSQLSISSVRNDIFIGSGRSLET
jgi:uncharacterized protein YijF (DUF1287 family)